MKPLADAVAALKLAAEVLDKDREVQDLYSLQTEVDAPPPANMDDLLDQYTQWQMEGLPHQPARDIINEFLQERGRPDQQTIMAPCAACQGEGSVSQDLIDNYITEKYRASGLTDDEIARIMGQPPLTTRCTACEGGGSVVNPAVEQKMLPWAQRLEDALHKEFTEWWPTSEASRTRSPETSGTKWDDHPDQPVTHWLNVEDFLNERYPEAATGSKYGGEYAQPLIDTQLKNDKLGLPQPTPEWLEANGYIGHGNVVTQAFLNLHNQHNRRPWKSKDDKRRTYELMLRHIGPGAVKRDPLKAAAATIRMAQQVLSATGQDLYASGLVEKLEGEFNEWAEHSAVPNPYEQQSWKPSILGDRPPTPSRGPVGYWPNVENFFKEKYPAAHQGFSMGLEDAQAALGDPNREEDMPWLGDKRYESGPEAVAKHGYDPSEVAAALLLLHNATHPGRKEWLDSDTRRITELFQTRMEMQRAYEEAQKKYEQDWQLPPKEDALAGAKDALVTARRVLAGTPILLHRGFVLPVGEVFDPAHHLDKGVGGHWSSDPEIAEGFADPQRMADSFGDDDEYGNWVNGTGVVVSAWYDPTVGGIRTDNLPFGTGDAAHEYEKETTLWGSTPLKVHTVKHRQAGDTQWQEHPQLSGRKIVAMPAPAPKGLHFKHDPNFVHPHADYLGRVEAYIDDQPVGHLEWLKEGNPLSLVTQRKPGEVSFVFVHPNYRRNSIATEMFDWAKKNAAPDLHHSERRTDLGDKWVGYEQTRQKAAAAIRMAEQILAMPQLTLPGGISIQRHLYRPGKQSPHWMADEVLQQNGPAILWKAIDGVMPGESLYIARDKKGTIHGVAKAMDIGSHHVISDLYSGRTAPNGTGTKLLRTIAQEAKKKGQGLFVTNIVPAARRYWESMGAVTSTNHPHGEFTPESHQALIDKDTIEAPAVEPDSDFDLMHSIPAEWREPGSAKPFLQKMLHGDDLSGQQDQAGNAMNRLIDMALNGPTGDNSLPLIDEDLDDEDPDAAYQKAAMAIRDTLAKAAAVLKFAEPLADAYDPRATYQDDYVPPEKVTKLPTTRGKWYHISPTDLPVGTKLKPRAGHSPFFYDDDTPPEGRYRSSLPGNRKDWVWFERKKKMLKWLEVMQMAMPEVHLYEVTPEGEGPWPWNGTGQEGHVSPAATIVRKIPTKRNVWGDEVQILWDKAHGGDDTLAKAAAVLKFAEPMARRS